MLELARYDAFIFDMDGTLLDSNAAHADAFAAAMLEAADYELTDAERAEFNGNTTRDFSAELATRHGLDLDPDAMVELKFGILYRDFRAEFFPGAKEFLDLWRDRKPMALASNSPREFVLRVMDREGLRDIFRTIVTIDDVPRRKPDPAIYRLALQGLGVIPDRTLVFEDSIYGIEAGVRAGCDVVVLDNPGGDIPADLPGGTSVRTWAELRAVSHLVGRVTPPGHPVG